MKKAVIGVAPLWDRDRDSYWMLLGYLEGLELADALPVTLSLTESDRLLLVPGPGKIFVNVVILIWRFMECPRKIGLPSGWICWLPVISPLMYTTAHRLPRSLRISAVAISAPFTALAERYLEL